MKPRLVRPPLKATRRIFFYLYRSRLVRGNQPWQLLLGLIQLRPTPGTHKKVEQRNLARVHRYGQKKRRWWWSTSSTRKNPADQRFFRLLSEKAPSLFEGVFGASG